MILPVARRELIASKASRNLSNGNASVGGGSTALVSSHAAISVVTRALLPLANLSAVDANEGRPLEESNIDWQSRNFIGSEAHDEVPPAPAQSAESDRRDVVTLFQNLKLFYGEFREYHRLSGNIAPRPREAHHISQPDGVCMSGENNSYCFWSPFGQIQRGLRLVQK